MKNDKPFNNQFFKRGISNEKMNSIAINATAGCSII